MEGQHLLLLFLILFTRAVAVTVLMMSGQSTSTGYPFQRSTRSPVWDHFEHISKKDCKCRKCGKVLSYTSSTSTMLNHLRSVHDIHVDHQERPLSGRMDAFVKVKEKRPPCSATTRSTINDLIVDWCVLDLRPLDIVNDRGLERLLDFLCPGYELPSRTHCVGNR